MIIDIPGQFRKLSPSYSRCIDLTPEQMLDIVEGHLEGCRHASQTGHWSYDLVRHLALAELRDAMIAKQGGQAERRAA